MFLFFNAQLTPQSEKVIFSREESKHITRVLRKKSGDQLQITNGNGNLFNAKISDDNPNKCEALIENFHFFEKSNFYTHIAIAPTKNNDRLEWFLEKATEIGINEITPIICKNSERKTIKSERLTKIMISAMKQSVDYYLPIFNNAINFSDFIQKPSNCKKFIAHCEDSKKLSFFEMIGKKESILILIGPEGDFDSSEIEMAKENGFKPVTLGNKRLRTETAAIVATHTISLKNE